MNTKNENKFGWGFLICGLLFFACAVAVFRLPATALTAVAFVIVFSAALNGIWLLTNSMGLTSRIVVGILDLVLAVFLLINMKWTLLAVPWIFAFWFILDSIFRLISLDYVRPFGKGYFWFSLILNVLGVILGIVLLFNPMLSALVMTTLIGIYLLIAGIEFIVLAFARPVILID